MRVAPQRRIVLLIAGGLFLIMVAASLRQRIVALGSRVSAVAHVPTKAAAGSPANVSESNGPASLNQPASGEMFMQISDEYLGIGGESPVQTTEVAALYWCASQAPEIEVGWRSLARLNLLISTVDLADLAAAIKWTGAPPNCNLRPIAFGLLARVRAEPAHPQAAQLLAAACAMTRESHDAAEPAAVFLQAADLIALNHASSADIGGFIDCLAAEGASPRWASAFESHLKTILECNPHPAIQCRALYAQACLARGGGREGNARAADLLHQLTVKFDGPQSPQLDVPEKNLLQHARVLHADLTEAAAEPATVIVALDVEARPSQVPDVRANKILLSLSTKRKCPIGADIAECRAVDATDERAIAKILIRDWSQNLDDWEIPVPPSSDKIDQQRIVWEHWIDSASADELQNAIEELVREFDFK